MFLAQLARHSVVQLTCFRAERLHELIAQASGGQGTAWQSRTATRDIAPLRNLTLLLSTVVDAQTTILVDDDVCCYDLEATHLQLGTHYRALGPVVVGAEIGGTSELDTITRLCDALCLLESNAQNSAVATKDLFRVYPDSHHPHSAVCQYLSAGYMAFRLPPSGLFAFPPGYNEDWLWCLLLGAGGRARLLRDDQVVVHEPPSLRQSTRGDILFEISGDLIFDCLAAHCDSCASGPVPDLERLADCVPDASMTPSVRAEATLKQALMLRENGHRGVIADLEGYGLRALRCMLHSGELEVDSTRLLREWSVDAVAKQKSFAMTLGDVTVRRALREAMKEGRK